MSVSKTTGRAVAELVGVLGAIRRGRTGATAIEYGLIAGLIALAIIVSVTLTGTKLNAMFGVVAARVATATPSA